MANPADIDQGGTAREWTNVYLGPSVGWTRAPTRNVFPITAAGTYSIDLSINQVQVKIAGAVTIILPSALNALGIIIPGQSVKAPITIYDAGGFAFANPITIKPQPGQTILGLAQIQITSNYGGFTLVPSGAANGWTNPQ